MSEFTAENVVAAKDVLNEVNPGIPYMCGLSFDSMKERFGWTEEMCHKHRSENLGDHVDVPVDVCVFIRGGNDQPAGREDHERLEGRVVDALKKHGVRVKLGSQYSVLGQIAQVINAFEELLNAELAGPTKEVQPNV